MKKIILTFLLLATTISVAFANESIVYVPTEAELLQQEIAVLEEKLAQAESLKDHYKQMAIYSDTAKELALTEAESYKERVTEIAQANTILRNSFNSLNDNMSLLIKDKDSQIKHYVQLLQGYEQTLFSMTQNNNNLTMRNTELEAQINNFMYIAYGGILVLLIVALIALIRSITVKSVKIEEPVKETVKEKVEKKKPSLKAVPKTDKKSKAKTGEKKNEQTSKNQTDTKKPEEVETTIDLDGDSELEKRKKPLSIWAKYKRARETRIALKLAGLRASTLTVKEGDVVSDGNPVIENNKNLLKGGVMKSFIEKVWNIKQPTPPPSTPDVETPVKEVKNNAKNSGEKKNTKKNTGTKKTNKK